jgi:hypothetical protein
MSSQALAAEQTPPQVELATPFWQPDTKNWLSHCLGGLSA